MVCWTSLLSSSAIGVVARDARGVRGIGGFMRARRKVTVQRCLLLGAFPGPRNAVQAAPLRGKPPLFTPCLLEARAKAVRPRRCGWRGDKAERGKEGENPDKNCNFKIPRKLSCTQTAVLPGRPPPERAQRGEMDDSDAAMPDSRQSAATRIDLEKAAMLPPVTGCAGAAPPARADRSRGSPRIPLIRRKVGGPTRKSSKGGWTPEEV